MSLMIHGVDPVSSATSLQSPRSIEGASRPLEDGDAAERATFGSILGNLVGEASQLEHSAVAKSEQLARGTLDDLHGTMIAVKEAEISMKLVGSVRNKLIEAFQEIWRTNV